MPEELTPIYGSLVSLGGAGPTTFSTGTVITSSILDCRDVASVGVADFAAGGAIGQSQIWTVGYAFLLVSQTGGALIARAATELYVILETWFSTVGMAAFGSRQIAYFPIKIPCVTVGQFRVQGDGARLSFNNGTGANFSVWWRAWGKVL